MLTYPKLDPVAFSVGPLRIYWYGVMYLIGFIVGYFILLKRRKSQGRLWTSTEVGDLVFYVALGVILGGRIGFVIVYSPELIFSKPWTLLEFWVPGRSFHGGLVGVIIALWYFSYKAQCRLLEALDFIAPVVPLGLGAGRLGNFFNGELWGRMTDLPWGMVFPHVDAYPRHPSQLYEFLLEGICMFIILMAYSRKPRATGRVSALFLIFYGIFRSLIEFWREPDLEQGFVAFNWLTMGQLLSLPMIIFGLLLWFYAAKKKSY